MPSIYDYVPTGNAAPWMNLSAANDPQGAVDPIDQAIEYLIGQGMGLKDAGMFLGNSNFLKTLYESTLKGYTTRATNGGVDPLSVRTPTAMEFLSDFQSSGLVSALGSVMSSRAYNPVNPAFSTRRIRF